MSDAAGAGPDPDEILIEITRIGMYLRVTAMHPPTLTEVTFQAPVQASQADLTRLAARKISYVLKKNAEEGQ